MNNMTVSQQQEISKEVLTKLQDSIDPKAIISGGAPRNWDYGELANDLDIYLTCVSVNKSRGEALRIIEHCLGINLKSCDQEGQPNDYPKFDWLDIDVLIGFMYKDVKVQIMFCSPSSCPLFLSTGMPFHKRIMNSHSIGLCRICYDGESIIRTYEYKKDFDNNTLTWYVGECGDQQIAHSSRTHLPKLLKYYPNHRLVIDTN